MFIALCPKNTSTLLFVVVFTVSSVHTVKVVIHQVSFLLLVGLRLVIRVRNQIFVFVHKLLLLFGAHDALVVPGFVRYVYDDTLRGGGQM